MRTYALNSKKGWTPPQGRSIKSSSTSAASTTMSTSRLPPFQKPSKNTPPKLHEINGRISTIRPFYKKVWITKHTAETPHRGFNICWAGTCQNIKPAFSVEIRFPEPKARTRLGISLRMRSFPCPHFRAGGIEETFVIPFAHLLACILAQLLP